MNNNHGTSKYITLHVNKEKYRLNNSRTVYEKFTHPKR